MDEFNSKFESPEKKMRISIEGNPSDMIYRSTYAIHTRSTLRPNNQSLDVKRNSDVLPPTQHMRDQTSYSGFDNSFTNEKVRHLSGVV